MKSKIFWCRLHTLPPTAQYPPTGLIPYLRSHPAAEAPHLPPSTVIPQHQTDVTPDLLLLPFQLWSFTFNPLIGIFPSNDAIISLSPTSIIIMWKSAKCLTQSLTLHRMQVFICVMNFYKLSHRHSWQATPEPATDFGQCGFSWFSCHARVPPGCSAS